MAPGDAVYFDYDEEEEPWHEAVLLAQVGGADWVILTPDGRLCRDAEQSAIEGGPHWPGGVGVAVRLGEARRRAGLPLPPHPERR